MLAKVALMDLHQAASQILAGSIRGRVVVNVNLATPQLKAADAWASNGKCWCWEWMAQIFQT